MNASLLAERHLTGLLETRRLEPVEINSRGYPVIIVVGSVPVDGLCPFDLLGIDERPDEPSRDIEDAERHRPGAWDCIVDLSGRIKRIGLILIERK